MNCVDKYPGAHLVKHLNDITAFQSSLEYFFFRRSYFFMIIIRPSTKALHNAFYIDPNWGAIYKTGMKQGIDLKVRSNLWNFWSGVLFHVKIPWPEKNSI